jgi:hypothetical protein
MAAEAVFDLTAATQYFYNFLTGLGRFLIIQTHDPKAG